MCHGACLHDCLNSLAISSPVKPAMPALIFTSATHVPKRAIRFLSKLGTVIVRLAEDPLLGVWGMSVPPGLAGGAMDQDFINSITMTHSMVDRPTRQLVEAVQGAKSGGRRHGRRGSLGSAGSSSSRARSALSILADHDAGVAGTDTTAVVWPVAGVSVHTQALPGNRCAHVSVSYTRSAVGLACAADTPHKFGVGSMIGRVVPLPQLSTDLTAFSLPSIAEWPDAVCSWALELQDPAAARREAKSTVWLFGTTEDFCLQPGTGMVRQQETIHSQTLTVAALYGGLLSVEPTSHHITSYLVIPTAPLTAHIAVDASRVSISFRCAGSPVSQRHHPRHNRPQPCTSPAPDMSPTASAMTPRRGTPLMCSCRAYHL